MTEPAPRAAVFISYSRADLSFVLWTARSLGENGIACWVDVERLVPGADWAKNISDAQNESPVLLLVASSESLGSSYCRQEYLRALESGKRVVVAAIEAVRLPRELTRCDVVDMRSWEAPPWAQLARAIRDGGAPAPASLRRTRIPKPLAMAGAALAVLFVLQVGLTMEYAVRAGSGLLRASSAVQALIAGHLMILIAWIAWSARWSWRFLVRGGTAMGLLGMVAVPWAWLMHSILALSSVYLVGLFVPFVMFAFVYFAPEMGMWAPARRRRGTTAAAENAFAAHSVAEVARPMPLNRAVRFGLYYTPADERPAMRVAMLMERAGHLRVWPHEQEEVRLLLLSNATPADFERLALRSDDVPRICVVLTALFVADERQAFHRHQWVEFRSRDDLYIERVARWLRGGKPVDTAMLLPETSHLGKTILPVGALLPASVMTILAALMTFAVLLPVLEMPFHDYSPSYRPRPLWGELAGAATGVMAAFTAAAVRGRLVTFPVYVGAIVVTTALLCTYAAAQKADAGFYPTAIFLIAAFCLFPWSELRGWLLSRPLAWRRATLAASPATAILMRQIALPLAVGSAVAVIEASCFAVRQLTLGF